MSKGLINNVLVELSQGNPGAVAFLMELLSSDYANSTPIWYTIVNSTSIRGTNLYILWNDLCGRDLESVEKLCRNCPISILEDACSRQDRSGKLLTDPFL